MAIERLKDLTTPEQYIEFYFNQFKSELEARGLQISKVGIVGLIMHTMGFTQYDIKQYFDTLFREAFLGTADLYENINMHGAVHGFYPKFSIPSQLVGDFRLKLNALPISLTTNNKLVIEKLTTIINGMQYKLDSTYTIKRNVVQIREQSGKIIQVPYDNANPVIPISGFSQYQSYTYEYNTPYYPENTHTRHLVEMEDDDTFVTNIEAYVQESGSDEYVEYEVRTVKYFTSSNEKVVFMKVLPNNNILIETGSGIYGKYIPDSNIRITVSTTSGERGNVSKQTVKPNEIVVRLYDNDDSQSRTFTNTNVLDIEIDYGDGGVNALDGEELRSEVINYIRSRENLVSELDFYTLLDNYMRDFVLMFKKTHVLENHIYLFQAFRDKYLNPIRSKSISVKHPIFNPDNECYVYRPIFTLNGIDYISPFLYVVDYVMRYYKAYLLFEKIARYFNELIIEENSPSQTALPLSLYVEYDPGTVTTRFYVQSYSDISAYVLYITIPELGIRRQCMQQVDSSTFEHFYAELMFETVDVEIEVHLNGEHHYTYIAENVSIIGDISDLLTLKTWEGEVVDYDIPMSIDHLNDISLLFPSDAYVLNIPIMVADEFYSNEQYYMTKFLNTFGSISEKENRMISDDVQIRFIDTDNIPSQLTRQLTTQKHNLDIRFPLVLSIEIMGYEDYVSENQINTVNDVNQLKLTLADALYNTYTGESGSFFRTQIVDIIHNYKWVKYCDVFLKDSNGTSIPGANFELVNQRKVVDNLSKREAALFCPIYMWWDLENITIIVNFE